MCVFQDVEVLKNIEAIRETLRKACEEDFEQVKARIQRARLPYQRTLLAKQLAEAKQTMGADKLLHSYGKFSEEALIGLRQRIDSHAHTIQIQNDLLIKKIYQDAKLAAANQYHKMMDEKLQLSKGATKKPRGTQCTH